MIHLKGKRINLRSFKKSDAESLCENIKPKIIKRYTANIPHPYNLKHAIIFIKKSKLRERKKEEYSLGIELKETKKIIGGISLMKIDLKNKNAELGYWLGKNYWGRGLTTEAVGLMLDFAFNKMKLNSVYARVFEENKGSSKVLIKSGFKQEGVQRQRFYRFGRWHHMPQYSILKHEYKK